MATSAMPDTDAALLIWLLNLADKVGLAPATYGVPALLNTSFQGAVESYQSALAACDPGERSRSRVTTKNEARDAAKVQARLVTNAVNATPTVTNAMKQELGLNVRKTPQKIGPPTQIAQMMIGKIVGNSVEVDVRALGTTKRGLPSGTNGLFVLSYAGENPPENPQDWTREGLSGKSRFSVQFTDVTPFQKVWLTCAYFSPSKALGVLCPPVSTYLGTWTNANAGNAVDDQDGQQLKAA